MIEIKNVVETINVEQKSKTLKSIVPDDTIYGISINGDGASAAFDLLSIYSNNRTESIRRFNKAVKEVSAIVNNKKLPKMLVNHCKKLIKDTNKLTSNKELKVKALSKLKKCEVSDIRDFETVIIDEINGINASADYFYDLVSKYK